MTQKVKRNYFLQLLLETYNPQAASALWPKLPIGDTEMPSPRGKCPLTDPLNANLNFLPRIHYTWLAHYISQLPDPLKKSVATTLPASKKILERLALSTDGLEKQGAIDPYLHRVLIEKIGLNEKLPICFLEKSAFDAILQWDRVKILALIDLLPLADASREIKQIVDRNRLMLIYSAFNEQQKNYIKHCMVSRHVVSEHPLNLRQWQGTKEELKTYLHKVGLELFAKGLHQESKDFLFYLSHLLDTGRGKPLGALAESGKKEEKKDAYFKNVNQAYKYLADEKT